MVRWWDGCFNQTSRFWRSVPIAHLKTRSTTPLQWVMEAKSCKDGSATFLRLGEDMHKLQISLCILGCGAPRCRRDLPHCCDVQRRSFKQKKQTNTRTHTHYTPSTSMSTSMSSSSSSTSSSKAIITFIKKRTTIPLYTIFIIKQPTMQ